MLALLLSAHLVATTPALSTVAEDVLKRELAADPEQFAPPKPFDLELPQGSVDPMKPIDADMLATLGGLMDAASTYYFTKARKGREGNSLIAFTNSHPEATALAALGGLAATKALTKLIRKASPRVAEAVAANLGSLQLAYGTSNWKQTRAAPGRLPRGHNHSSSADYQLAIHRLATRQK